MKITHYILPLAMAVSANAVMAEKFGWFYNPQAVIGPFKSPDALCASLGGKVASLSWTSLITWGAPSRGSCDNAGGTGFFLLGDGCDQGEMFDAQTLSCVPEEDQAPSLCPDGSLDVKGHCDPLTDLSDCSQETGGNPVIIASGQKVEIVNDISIANSSLTFSRNYWSSRLAVDELGIGWQHNWQKRIEPLKDPNRVKLYKGNGRGIIYNLVNGSWESYSADRDVLIKLDNNQGWQLYTMASEIETYNQQGQLIRYQKAGSLPIQLTYNTKGLLTELTEVNTANKLTLTYNSKGLISQLTANAKNIVSYTYDAKNRLTKVTQNGKFKTYLYENTQYPNLLTGITDEMGIRSATWIYNNKGQAISSEHANGTDKYLFEYLDKYKTRVTNPLGKQATYYFDEIRQSKKITKIEGEPINSCIGSNVSYRYNAKGLVVGKTDNNKNDTYYKYNDRGLETERLFANNTNSVRYTTYTKWHDTLPLPLEIEKAGQVTSFQYDNVGRLIEYRKGHKDAKDIGAGQDSALLQFDDFNDPAGHTWQSIGNPQLIKDSTAITGNSLYLDGNSYLSTAIDDRLQFGTGDFTIEFRFKPELPLANNAPVLIDAMHRQSHGTSWSIFINPNGELYWQSYDNYTSNIINQKISDIDFNVEHHFAITRKNGIAYMFLDGRLKNTFKLDKNISINNETTSLGIGAMASESNNKYYYKGMIDQLRIAKKALYTESFIPYAKPYQLNTYPNVGLPDSTLLQFNDLSDPAGNIWTPVGNANTIKDNLAIGGNALSLDGKSSYITTPLNEGFIFGVGNFTIEAWVKPETLTGNKVVVDFYENTNYINVSWQLLLNSGKLSFYTSKYGYQTVQTSLTVDEWTHIAVSRSDGVVKLFVNGKLSGSFDNTYNYSHPTRLLAIGAQASSRNPGDDFKGLIGQVRITKKALYKESFIPSHESYIFNKGTDN